MNKQKKIDRLSDWTAHDARMREHYDHARRKHPYLCDRMLPAWAEPNIKDHIRRALEDRRARLKQGEADGNLMWNEVLDCECWEVAEALANGDTAAAVEELYDCVAVLLRTIDVLEGRQKLGKPETKGKAK